MVTKWIEDRANDLMKPDPHGVARLPYARTRRARTTKPHDYLGTYIGDLAQIIDMDTIQSAKLKLGADPLGGSGIAY